jgi:hypothetical protein
MRTNDEALCVFDMLRHLGTCPAVDTFYITLLNTIIIKIIMKKFIAVATVVSLLGGAVSVFAAGDVNVNNNNSATLTNSVQVYSSSGSNTANGGYAKGNTEGGNVNHSNFNNLAGNGGSTVMGGDGGTIVTGGAVATVDILNKINTNKTDVNATNWAVNAIKVHNTNGLSLTNAGITESRSGINDANGKSAYQSTEGGNLDNAGATNTAGNAGSNVRGGNGGRITTGNAVSAASVVNVLNRNITRIVK